MKSWEVIILIALVLLRIFWITVAPEKKSFSLLSKRGGQQQFCGNDQKLGWDRFFCRYDFAVIRIVIFGFETIFEL